MDVKTKFRIKIKNNSELISSIENNEFIIFLQPKFDTIKEEVVGAEALVRKLKDGKIIMPNEFIPQYEKTGLITKLDTYVLEEVCKLQKKWRELNFPLLPISINESRLHLKNKNHIQELQEIISRYDTDANLIELEMTETTVVEDILVAKKAAESVKKLGFIVSMDDFGTGYSAFNILKDIEIDILKIDKEFFKNLENNKRAQIIIETIIKMCKKLKIKTVAEGIETKEQVDFLKKVGCDIIQGYYFSKPITISKFEEKYLIKRERGPSDFHIELHIKEIEE